MGYGAGWIGSSFGWLTNPQDAVATGTVTSVGFSAGTGISVSGTNPITTSGTITITNSAPDQTVVLNSGGGISVSGTYPNFTISTAATIPNIDYIDFNTSYTTPLGVGQLGWDGNDTLGIGMSGGNVVQEIGLQSFIYGKASSAITKGQLIKKTGANGSSGVITFAPTTANMTNGGDIIGIAAENISLNAFGYICSVGNLRGFNTTGASSGETWVDGDTLYYNPTGNGLMTKTKPSAPNIKTEVGVVINAGSGGSGSVVVEIIHGSVLGGTDSNVEISSVTGGQLLSYDQANQYWKNTNLASGTGISVNSATNGTITVTNSAPDQTVSISAGTGIGVTGTYPNFTITNSSPSSGGTVTSVSALTLGTSGTDINSTVANSTTTPVITLNVPDASASNRGALTSTDWTTFNNKLNLSGGTMTGYLILNADPINGLGATTKDYVDNLVNGIDWKASANAATVASLPSYVVSGSGQVLTGSVNGAIPSATTDGVTLVATNRVLVKNETLLLAPNNGIYTVTQAGNGSTKFILTRSSDANTSNLLSEATLSISGGSTLNNTQWHCNPASTPITIGVTNINFSQIGSGVYLGTAPINISGNTISIAQSNGSTNGYLSSTDWTTFNGKQNTLTNPVTGTGTNNEIAAFNSTGSTITSLTTATYPSLTELSYVKGVTSAIQTQINGRVNDGGDTMTGSLQFSGTTIAGIILNNLTTAQRTALTPSAGMTVLDTSLSTMCYYTGTYWAYQVYKIASNTTTTAVTASNITGLSFDVEANSTYDIDGYYSVVCNNTGGIKFTQTVPTGATIEVNYDGIAGTAATSIKIRSTASGTLTPNAINTANLSSGVMVRGILITSSTAGTLVLQFASGVSTQTSTITPRSNVKITKIA